MGDEDALKTIAVKKSTKDRLDKEKVIEGESYDSVIQRILDNHRFRRA